MLRKCVEIIKNKISDLNKFITETKKSYFSHFVVIGTVAVYYSFWIAIIIISTKLTWKIFFSIFSKETIIYFMSKEGILFVMNVNSLSFHAVLILAFILIPVLNKYKVNNNFLLTNKYYDLFYKTCIVLIVSSALCSIGFLILEQVANYHD